MTDEKLKPAPGLRPDFPSPPIDADKGGARKGKDKPPTITYDGVAGPGHQKVRRPDGKGYETRIIEARK